MALITCLKKFHVSSAFLMQNNKLQFCLTEQLPNYLLVWAAQYINFISPRNDENGEPQEPSLGVFGGDFLGGGHGNGQS